MSILLAVKKNNDLIMAADTLMSFGSNRPRPGNVVERKMMPVGTAFLGLAGWGLYDNIFTDYLDQMDTPPRLDTKHAVFSFFREFWHVLHDKYSFVNDQPEEKNTPFGDLDASFIIAASGRIFFVSSNMNVTEFQNFHAIGSGCEYAIGAMHVLYDSPAKAEDIARKGVEAAMIHDVYCGGEVDSVPVA